MSSKKRFISIDIIKVLSCIFVLLYHLNILNGGFLAVCIFFTLSGYLSCISLFNKEKISLKKYYYNRLLKLYIPLILVVFISIAIISLNKDIVWFNLKPETTSILLGYNNFWQLSANQDYFARHISSPFMHLWYISILLQFDLIFPFIFIFLKKIGDKIHKIIPCIITAILSVIFTIYFYKISTTQSIMFTYYNTFTRVFSLLFGVLLGFIHSYGKVFIPKNNKYITKIIYYLYLIIILLLCIFINKDFLWYMIITTLITCRLIDYGIV